MFERGSRYEFVKPFTLNGTEEQLFRGTRPRDVKTEPGVLEHTLVEGDRLDLLALHYYNDARKWWLIIDANPQIIYGGDLILKESLGMTILIPRDIKPGTLR